MEDQIDFSGAKLEDFKVGGVSLTGDSDADQNPPAVEPAVANPVEPAPVDPEPVKQGPITPVEPIKPEPVAPKVEEPVRYKFKDEFIEKAVEYYEKTGDLTPYLQAKTVDFDKMSDEDVLRRNLREQYPEVSETAFERLYHQEVINKFKLNADEYDPEDVALGKELLRTQASKIRGQYKQWQESFRAPEPGSVPAKPENDEADLQAATKYREEVMSDAATKALIESKRVAIKTADGEVTFELPDVQEHIDMTLAPQQFFKKFVKEDGSIDYGKWYRAVSYASNEEAYISAIHNDGKHLGREEITKEIKNPSTPGSGGIPTETGQDFASGLLGAFASRGVHK